MAHPHTVDRLEFGDHVCWTFDDEEECLDATARFVASGLGHGDRVRFHTASLPPDAALDALRARGVEVDEPASTGQLEARDAHQTYLDGGGFDPQRVIGDLAGEAAAATAAGYRGLRVVGDMGWAQDAGVDLDALAWYEAHVNTLFADGTAIGLCQYDRRLFPDRQLRRLGTAHPGTTWSPDDQQWRPLLRMRRGGDPPVLRLVGEVDISNHHALAPVLDAMLAGEAGNGHPGEARAARTAGAAGTAEAGRARAAGDATPAGGAPASIDASELDFADVATAERLVVAARTAPAGMEIRGCTPAVARTLTLIGALEVAGMTVTTRAAAGRR